MNSTRDFASTNRADGSALCARFRFGKMENHVAPHCGQPVESICRIKKHLVRFCRPARRAHGRAKQSVDGLEVLVGTQSRGRKNDEQVGVNLRRKRKLPDFPLLHEARLRAAARATALTSAASRSDSERAARVASPRPAAAATAFASDFLPPPCGRRRRLEGVSLLCCANVFIREPSRACWVVASGIRCYEAHRR